MALKVPSYIPRLITIIIKKKIEFRGAANKIGAPARQFKMAYRGVLVERKGFLYFFFCSLVFTLTNTRYEKDKK